MPAASIKWKSEIDSLKTFVGKHTDIEIKKNMVVIPLNCREEFYSIFDAAGKAFIEDNFKEHLAQAEKLSENYIRIEKDILSLYPLEKITMLGDIELFLHKPHYAIRRPLTESVFALLREELDNLDFEEVALQKANSTIKRLFPAAFNIWIAASLIRLLDGDSFYRVSLYDLQTAENAFHDGMIKKVPPPEISRSITFEHANTVFVIADIILFSKLINKYVAIKVNPARASTRAEIVSEERDWVDIDAKNILNPDILIYSDSNLANLNLVKDSARILKPDVLVENIEQFNSIPEKFEIITALNAVLAPAERTCIVSATQREFLTQNQNMEEAVRKFLSSDNLGLLTPNYDESNLKPIVELLQ